MKLDALIEDLKQRVRHCIGRETAALHEPVFEGSEGKYLQECLDSTFVSSVGKFVDELERKLEAYTGAPRAVVVVNGTAALQISLVLSGVEPNDEVLMPSLTFVATANAALYCGAVPHFVDVSAQSLGIDPKKLVEHLDRVAEKRTDGTFNKESGKRIKALVPMHAFGFPAEMPELIAAAKKWNLAIVEDAAESLGSFIGGKHTGTSAPLSAISFNGNKICTTGGGGAILAQDPAVGARAKHLTTTAKAPSQNGHFLHDEMGYNFRMPNLNAALGCAQMEALPDFLVKKRHLATCYRETFADFVGGQFFWERAGTQANFWLNTLILNPEQASSRDEILQKAQEAGLGLRPVWTPMHQLPFLSQYPRSDLSVTNDLAARILNLPSSAFLGTRRN